MHARREEPVASVYVLERVRAEELQQRVQLRLTPAVVHARHLAAVCAHSTKLTRCFALSRWTAQIFFEFAFVEVVTFDALVL